MLNGKSLLTLWDEDLSIGDEFEALAYAAIWVDHIEPCISWAYIEANFYFEITDAAIFLVADFY